MRRILPALLVVLFLFAPAFARWKTPSDVPVERLVANLGAYVKEHPEDAHGHYVLARVHGLALTLKSTTVRAYLRRDGSLPGIDHQFHGRTKTKGTAQPAALRKHLHAALKHFAQAIKLDPQSGLYRLGQAYVVEVAGTFVLHAPVEVKISAEERARIAKLVELLASKSEAQRAKARADLRRAGVRAGAALELLLTGKQKADPEVVRQARALMAALWTDEAIKIYWAAFERSEKRDAALESKPIRGLSSLVSHEAAGAYVRLVKESGGASAAQKERVERAQAHCKNFRRW